MYGHKDIFLFKVSDPLKTQTTFDQRKEVIVVKYSEIQNGKVFRFLQISITLTFWLTASTSLLKVVTAGSSPMGHSLKGLNFHHREFPGSLIKVQN